MAWLTTVRPNGQPDTVPVWFLVRDDESILIFTQPNQMKLRNIDHNPRVSLGLDVTDIGRDIVRVEGTAELVAGHPPAHAVPEYAEKYAERLGALFGTAEKFADVFSAAIVITPVKLRASVPSTGVEV